MKTKECIRKVRQYLEKRRKIRHVAQVIRVLACIMVAVTVLYFIITDGGGYFYLGVSLFLLCLWLGVWVYEKLYTYTFNREVTREHLRRTSTVLKRWRKNMEGRINTLNSREVKNRLRFFGNSKSDINSISE